MKTFPDTITVPKLGPNGKGRGKDIQKAINRALRTKKYCTIYVPCGEWELKKPLRLYLKESENHRKALFNFGIHLMGARPAYGGQGAEASFTTLKCLFSNGPAIDIQATRATTLSNIALEGQNTGLKAKLFTPIDGERFPTLHLDHDEDGKDWWLDKGVNENHVAIAIDRYPGIASSQVLIDNVNARFFAGGISFGTSGDENTLLCDKHLVRRFNGHFLGKAGIIIGHDQCKGIKITDSYFTGQQYWIDCVNQGLQKGYPPVISGCTVEVTQRLFNLHHSYGHFSCQGLFVESTLSLGTLGYSDSSQNIPAAFNGCNFSLYQQSGTRAIDTHLLAHRPVLFQGCTFQFNKDEDTSEAGLQVAAFRAHNTQQLVFDTCSFVWKSQNALLPMSFHQEPYVHLRNCSYQSEWWVPAHGKVHSLKLTLGNVTLEKDSNGEVTFILDGEVDLRVGDFCGFDKLSQFWKASIHVEGVSPDDHPNTLLPFATIGQLEYLADTNQTKVSLHQVAKTIYQQLDLPQEWALYKWQTIIVEPAAIATSAGALLEHIKSGNNAEKTDFLPVTKRTLIPATETVAEHWIPEILPRKVIYSERLSNIRAGEVIVVLSQFETTNALEVNVGVSSQLVLANAATDTIGTEITEASGFNVTDNMHHGKTVEVGSIVSPGNYAEKYVNVLAWAYSSATSDGDTIQVEPDYGRLTVLRFSAP